MTKIIIQEALLVGDDGQVISSLSNVEFTIENPDKNATAEIEYVAPVNTGSIGLLRVNKNKIK